MYDSINTFDQFHPKTIEQMMKHIFDCFTFKIMLCFDFENVKNVNLFLLNLEENLNLWRKHTKV